MRHRYVPSLEARIQSGADQALTVGREPERKDRVDLPGELSGQHALVQVEQHAGRDAYISKVRTSFNVRASRRWIARQLYPASHLLSGLKQTADGPSKAASCRPVWMAQT